jgi:Flp pilus assembly protein TadD
MGKGKQNRLSEETFLIESAIAEIIAANAGIGSAEVAESKLRGVLELEPNLEERVEAHNLLAQLYAQTARHREALEHFSAAVMVDPGVAAPLTEAFAEMFEEQEEWERAMEVYALGLAHAEDAMLHNGLGYCLGKVGRLRESEYHSRRATELAPDTAAYVNDLGYVLMEQRMFQEARVLFEHALRLDPSHDLARGNLRLCYEEAPESV